MTAWKSVTIYLCSAGLAIAISGCTSPGNRPTFLSSLIPGSSASSPLKNPVATNIAYAKFQESRQQHRGARKHYEKALSHDQKSVDAILGLARLDQIAGIDDRAKRGFQKAVQIAPKNAHAQSALGMYHLSKKQWNPAVSSLRKAMTADPDNTNYRYHLGVAMANTGDTRAAMQYFTTTVGEAVAHYNIGHILHERGQLALAEQHFQQALTIQPGMPQAQQMLKDMSGNGFSNKGAPVMANGTTRQQHFGHQQFMKQQLPSRPPIIQSTAHQQFNNQAPTHALGNVQRPFNGGQFNGGRFSNEKRWSEPTASNFSNDARQPQQQQSQHSGMLGHSPFQQPVRHDKMSPEQREQWANQRDAQGRPIQ